MTTRVCFIGGARYGRPLDATSEKKFRALKALGDLYIVGFSKTLRPRRYSEHARLYLMPNVPVSMLRYLEVFTVGTAIVCWLVARHGVNVVVTQSPYEGLAGAAAKKIAEWFGYRVCLVVENHGDFEESVFLQRRVVFSGLYRFLMQRVACFSLGHADLLRAISTSTRKQLERWVPEKSITQFPTWTDIDAFLQAGAGPERRSSQDIVYVGVLIPRKGVHHLIAAFGDVASDFPGARLVIVGSEDNKSYASGLKRQAKALGLEGRVLFMDTMAQAKLAVRMGKSRVCVLPSASEALGRVVIEAMATYTPVIGSNVGGIPDMVKDGESGFLVPPGDETVLAEKIRWILNHPEEAKAMGCKGRAFAEQFFSTEAYVSGYRRIFEAARALTLREGGLASSTL
ncbi:MAG: glycosyltransferase family 4 protein [Gammaproteobacteria bacterium]